jgi:hypothetical protein
MFFLMAGNEKQTVSSSYIIRRVLDVDEEFNAD